MQHLSKKVAGGDLPLHEDVPLPASNQLHGRGHRLVDLLSVHDLKILWVPTQIPKDRLDLVMIPHQDTAGQPLLFRHRGRFQRHLILSRRNHHNPSRKCPGFLGENLQRSHRANGKRSR